MTSDLTLLEPEISVVIPCYNEQENAGQIAAAVIAVLDKVTNSFDIIFIDNASADDTVQVIRAICESDHRVRLIVNTRNFGQMRSPAHAVFEARGRAVIGISADFQDPPELLEEFVIRWRAGADIVLGVRGSERTSATIAWFRRLSYAFAARFADYPVIPNATGFGIYDRKVIRAIESINEPDPFFRGLLVETGFPIQTVTYARPARVRGKSNNNFFTLLDFALSSLASFSKKTVRVPLYIGAILAIIALLSLLGSVVSWVIGGPSLHWLVGGIIEVQFALLFMFLGLIGDQTRLISERSRATPLVFERERVNFPEGY